MINYKPLFTPEECKEIIRLAETNQDTNPTSHEYEAKKYFGWNFDYADPNNRWVYERLFTWLKEATGDEINRAKLIQNERKSPMFVHKYSDGDFFIRHKDKMPNDTFYRIYNFGIQLSDEADYEGGELVCWDHEENETVFPKEVGTALFYSSELAHEVKPILKGNRYSFILILDADYVKKVGRLI